MKRAFSLLFLFFFAGFLTPTFADDIQNLLTHCTTNRVWGFDDYPIQTPPLPPTSYPFIQTPPNPDSSIPPTPFPSIYPPPTYPPSKIDAVNYICAQWDNHITSDTFPFDTLDSPAYEVTPNETLHFVRLTTNPDPTKNAGSWMMQSQYVRGLTAQELRDRFALPNVPIYIVMVDLPPTTPNGNVGLWVGTAAAIRIPGNNIIWGFGSGPQIRLISDPPPYTTQYFVAGQPYVYGWPSDPSLPVNPYFTHKQLIGNIALSYKPMAGNGNAGRMASYLDTYSPPDFTDLWYVYTTLDSLNWVNFGPNPLQDALNQLSASRYDALDRIEMRNALLFGNTLLERNYSLRRSLCLDPCSGCSPTRCPGLWTQAIGEFGNERREGELFGFTYQTGGVVVGMDAPILPCLVVGWSGAYLGSYMSWEDDLGSGHIDNGRFGVYASYFPGCSFVDAALCFGMNHSHTLRHVEFSNPTQNPFPTTYYSVNRNAKANESGHDFEFHLDGGTNYNWCDFLFTPLARLSYFNIKENQFHESGANSINLFVDDFGAETLRSHLELGVSRCFETCCSLKIIPQIQIAWAHDFPLDNRLINSTFANTEQVSTVYGFRDNTNSLIAGGELTLLTAKGVLFTGRYDAEIRNHFTAQEASLNLRYNF